MFGKGTPGPSRSMRPVKARATRRVSLWTADRIFRRMMLAMDQGRHSSCSSVESSVALLAWDTGGSYQVIANSKQRLGA